HVHGQCSRFPVSESKKPRLGYQSGLFESGGSLGFCRAAFLVIRSMKILWAARALAKIKAITKPPEKHSSDRSCRFFTESLQNIQLTGRVCRLHAFQYISRICCLATVKPVFAE